MLPYQVNGMLLIGRGILSVKGNEKSGKEGYSLIHSMYVRKRYTPYKSQWKTLVMSQYSHAIDSVIQLSSEVAMRSTRGLSLFPTSHVALCCVFKMYFLTLNVTTGNETV